VISKNTKKSGIVEQGILAETTVNGNSRAHKLKKYNNNMQKQKSLNIYTKCENLHKKQCAGAATKHGRKK